MKLNGPQWRHNRPVMDYMQGVIDFLGMVLRIVIYSFVLGVTVRLLVFLAAKIF